MHKDSADCVPIPGPKKLPVVGNVLDITPGNITVGCFELGKIYGDIFKLDIAGERNVFVGSRELLEEVWDEKRFQKNVVGPLEVMRLGVHDGLITARTEEQNWKIAHRIAMPAFGPLKMRDLFDPMMDIIQQLCLKWARRGSSYEIDALKDLTRMALDVVGLCTMNYRFNSFYSESETPPFVTALNAFLSESDRRGWFPDVVNHFRCRSKATFQAAIATMRDETAKVIEYRRAHGTEQQDLLSIMMSGKDPETGSRMSDSSLIDNVITFLGAGHETTSGTLAFSLYHLVKNPWAMTRAQRELDSVLGDGPLTVDHLAKLPYIDAILRETLRLTPTVGMISLKPTRDQVLGGKYFISKDDAVNASMYASHRDPKVYGEDADLWKPERMLVDEFKKLPPNAWKPFGNGVRACIGRPFAWQESQIALAMLLRTFNFELLDPSYEFTTREAITLSPVGLKLRATIRDQQKYNLLLAGQPAPGPEPRDGLMNGAKSKKGSEGKPMSILFGSGNGTCESLAHRFASDAARYGFDATVDALNSAKEKLVKGQPTIIFSSSYNGEPPANAASFLSWIESPSDLRLGGVDYAVFACGHRDWASTLHKVPASIDQHLAKHGGKRIAPMGTADEASGDIYSEFEKWQESVIWPALATDKRPISAADTGPGFKIAYPRIKALHSCLGEVHVVSTTTLTEPGTPVKKHMEIRLPAGMTYTTGDHLVVLPVNPNNSIQRALARFGLGWDAELNPESPGELASNLPLEHPLPAATILGQYVELASPASTNNIKLLATATNDPTVRDDLLSLASNPNLRHGASVLDLLEQHPSLTIPIGTFLNMLPPLRTRTYSISSSPLPSPTHATLTWTVVNHPAPTTARAPVLGVASTYLASLRPGALFHAAIRAPTNAFRPPRNAHTTPIIMVAAGTGIAPFRAFCAERAAARGPLAPALLFFGCRGEGGDDLYRGELDAWEAAGVVEVRRAYSRGVGRERGYVQDRVWEGRGRVAELWARGAKCYVCGSGGMAARVKEVVAEIAWEVEKGKGGLVGEGRGTVEWLDSLGQGRYVADVFA
ncbi:uncharacterized protein K452DRAFT_244086 [Neofusicoccum parvum]|nr:uncharacterized protein K452DRAFT_244086 [Neofusicoccum parvum]